MKPEMIAFLKDLADVLEKHKGGLTYTIYDDGVYATLGGGLVESVCIEWPQSGDCSVIRKIISDNSK